MKRVLFVGNLFPLPWEPGRGLFNWRQMRELSRGYHVSAVVPVPWQIYWRRSREERQPVERDNIRIILVCFWYLPGFLRSSYALSMFLSLLFAWRKLVGLRPDAVLASWFYPDAVASVVVARLLGVPVVIKAHGTDVNSFTQNRLRCWQMRWAARRARAVYVVSQALAKRLQDCKIGEDRVEVIYNGIELERFVPGDKSGVRHELGWPEARTLLFVGNLKVEKGVLDLVEGIRLSSLAAAERVVIVGDGPDRARLTERIQQLGLEDRVYLHGWCPPEDVGRMMRASDLLVLPSHAEGVPNVILEAMACGCPVLATDVGGIGEVVPPSAGRLVPVGKPAELAAAIESMASRTFDAKVIRHHAELFTWPDNAVRVAELLFGK